MNYSEECLQILRDDTNLYTILWNLTDGWMHFGNSSLISLPDTFLVEKGLDFLSELVTDEDNELCQAFLNNLRVSPKAQNPVTHQIVPLHLHDSNQKIRYCRLECDVLWENGEQKSLICKIREATAEEIYRLRLAQTITNDKNPVYFANGVSEIIQKYPERKFALVQFDIAKFKLINEQYGEAFGTEILQFIIHDLKMICNNEQLYARLSADLFMVFTAYETKQDILDLIDRITEQLSHYKGINYRLDFGVCDITDANCSIRVYGDNATLARKSIKNDALTHIAFYNEELRQEQRTRKFVEDRMENALANGEFTMFLQPKYSISQNTIIGAEALVRWFSPERGLLQPMDFLPLFEQNNFIIKVDYYIWEEACKTIRNWMDNGIQPVPISVNVSRKHLFNGHFIAVLNSLIEKYRIDRKYLEIEITETAKGTDVTNSVRILKENGYTLLMDDFGSGYSTLSTLKDTQFDVLKIDREFLQNFIGSERGEKIVAYIIKMTQSIGLDLIAEGVENRKQTIFLSHYGCDKVQGYYYAKPMSLDDFNKKRS